MSQVRDIMTTELVVVSPQLSLRDLLELLAQQHLGGAPVVAEGKLVGVITLDDVVAFQASLPAVPTEDTEEQSWDGEPRRGSVEGDEAVAAYFVDLWPDTGAELPERAAALRGPEWDLLSEHSVEEAMSRQLSTIGPEEAIDVAARKMEEHDIHRLLVVEEGRLSGIVTVSDVTRAVAEGRI
ncbi:MAG TPA: CBS domain-containing protein [Gemmatimonadales bacterium]|jgi:CBS domain-containing protein|nr:CBS domain-containing protein [Gemmatimonadales bacterium]